MSLEKRRIIIKVFKELQFSYWPLIWMLHTRTLDKKISRIHERALRAVYSDYKSCLNELLDKDGFFTVYRKISKV